MVKTHCCFIMKTEGVVCFDYVQEKFRIWKKEVEEPPPSMKDVSLVLLGDQGSETLMGDNHNIEYYLHDLASGKIKYVLRRYFLQLYCES